MISTLLLASALVYVNSAAYLNAVDINQLGTSSAFSCLRSSSYSTVFIRAYHPDGYVDPNGVPNINLAYQAGLGTEVYMTPNPSSSKTAAAQVDEVISALKNGGISVRSLWLQVTSPLNWPSNVTSNRNSVSAAITRIRASGVRPGVYTSNYDWQQITGQDTTQGSDVMLWYWSVYASGAGGESSPNFSDFRAFGSWTAAAVKQYGQYESICGFSLNRDVYEASSSSSQLHAAAQPAIAVGSIGL